MNDIKALFEIFNELPSAILIVLIFIAGIVAIVTLIEKVSVIIGKPVKWVREKQKDHELLIQTIQDLSDLHNTHEEDTKQSIRHDEIIREDLRSLTKSVNNISERLDIMQEKIDATEMAKLKEKILGYYRKYKDVGEWQRFESDVFWGLYDRYISHGGNSFVQHDIEPTMRNLKVID